MNGFQKQLSSGKLSMILDIHYIVIYDASWVTRLHQVENHDALWFVHGSLSNLELWPDGSSAHRPFKAGSGINCHSQGSEYWSRPCWNRSQWCLWVWQLAEQLCRTLPGGISSAVVLPWCNQPSQYDCTLTFHFLKGQHQLRENHVILISAPSA